MRWCSCWLSSDQSSFAWVSDREPPIKYETATALATSVPQGGTIDVEFSVFRKRICRCPLIAGYMML